MKHEELPDGTYFDGTYEWVKDENDWTPLYAPFGMPSRPKIEGLQTVTKVYGPLVPLPTVEHYRVGAGKCNCGFNAYQLRGIMIDYHEELMSHFRRTDRERQRR